MTLLKLVEDSLSEQDKKLVEELESKVMKMGEEGEQISALVRAGFLEFETETKDADQETGKDK